MNENKETLLVEEKIVTIYGVTKVVEVDDKSAVFQTSNGKITIKGSGLNIVKLDNADGVVKLEKGILTSITFGASAKSGLKGLFS